MHTYRGPNGLTITYNGDYSGMAMLRYQRMETQIPAEDVRAFVEPVLRSREMILNMIRAKAIASAAD